MFIEGHTDETGGEGRNWRLSTERAVNTYRELIQAASALRDLQNRHREEIISVSGYAYTRPVDRAKSAAGYARNRRIDLRFVMEVDNRERLREVLKLTGDMKGEIERLKSALGD